VRTRKMAKWWGERKRGGQGTVHKNQWEEQFGKLRGGKRGRRGWLASGSKISPGKCCRVKTEMAGALWPGPGDTFGGEVAVGGTVLYRTRKGAADRLG